MTYLITGGTGANGSQVVQELVKRHEMPVIFDVFPRLELIKEVITKVKIIKGDVTNFIQLLDTIKNERIDRVIHLAYLLATSDVSRAFKVNLIGTFNVLEAARILDVKKVVFISSWQVYGDVESKIPMPEDYPKTPKTHYEAGKYALEIWGKSYAKTYGLDFIALRFPRLYGLSRVYTTYAQPPGIDSIVLNAVHGKPSQIVAGDEKIQLLYLKDMANSILLAATCERPERKVFNIGSEEYFSIKEVADFVRKLIPSAKIEVVPPKEKTKYHLRGLDYKAAQEELGYTSQYTLEKGLKDYITWLRLNIQN